MDRLENMYREQTWLKAKALLLSLRAGYGCGCKSEQESKNDTDRFCAQTKVVDAFIDEMEGYELYL